MAKNKEANTIAIINFEARDDEKADLQFAGNSDILLDGLIYILKNLAEKMGIPLEAVIAEMGRRLGGSGYGVVVLSGEPDETERNKLS